MIRLAQPAIDERDIAAVSGVLESGWLIQGAEVRAFEQELSELTGAAHAVAVSSGTAALHLGLLALGVGPGDEVAVAAFSWPAPANAIVMAGARPVFVDIEPRTLGMNPELLGSVLAARPSIKAVIPVHAFGAIADVAGIMGAAQARGIPVLEDAACAIGVHLDGCSAGTWGIAGCFSFHPRKVVTTGEGGAVVTNDRALADRVRALRNHGLDPNNPAPDFTMAGLNCRMTDFQGALGRVQLSKLPELLAARRTAASWYADALADVPVERPHSATPESHNYQSYVVLLPSALAPHRDSIIQRLRRAGVEATIGTHHIPLTGYYQREFGYRPGDFPVTDDIAARAVSLPMHHALLPEDPPQVALALAAAMAESLR